MAEAGGGTTPKRMQLTVVDPAYPYTELISGDLIMRGSGPIRIFGQCAMSSGFQSCTATLRINNGADVIAGNTATVSSFVYDFNDASDGDILSLWETDSPAASNLNPGQSNIYLYYVPLNSTQFCSAAYRASSF